MHFYALRDLIHNVIEFYYHDVEICDECSLEDYIAQALICADIVKEDIYES